MGERKKAFIINFLMVLFLVSCSDTEEEEFTITNTAGDGEEVKLIFNNGVEKKLLFNQCILLKKSQFYNLRIKAGLGGRPTSGRMLFTDGYKNLCGGGAVRIAFFRLPIRPCVVANYEIQDIGIIIDNYKLVPVRNKNASCSKNTP